MKPADQPWAEYAAELEQQLAEARRERDYFRDDALSVAIRRDTAYEELATVRFSRDEWRAKAEAAEALVASYDRQDELIVGTEFEGVDQVTDVIRILKEKREAAIKLQRLTEDNLARWMQLHEKVSAERDALKLQVEEVELKLVAVGEFAIADWDARAVGLVDAAVKEPRKYKDRLKALFIDIPAERDQARSEVSAWKDKADAFNALYLEVANSLSPETEGHGSLLEMAHKVKSEAKRYAALVEAMRGALEKTTNALRRMQWLSVSHSNLWRDDYTKAFNRGLEVLALASRNEKEGK